MNILLQTDTDCDFYENIFFCVGQDSNYKRNYYIINAYKVKLRSLYLHVYIVCSRINDLLYSYIIPFHKNLHNLSFLIS